MIVRSNGVVTYVGKDIANQFWKFGLLGLDFRYRLFADAGERPRAVGDDVGRERAGRAAVRPRARASTTSSTRGRCTCRRCSARRCGRSAIPSEAENSIHFSYEMVALSHATARELGYRRPSAEDARKPFVEVSGRKGLGVKIDDLLDLLDRQGGAEVAQAQPGVHAPRSASASARRSRSPRSATSC